MNAESRLAQILSSAPKVSSEKLAHAINQLPVEEVELIFRAEMKKEASAELSFEEELALADRMGRELAHADLEKTAGVADLAAKGAGAVRSAGQALMGAGTGTRAAVGAGIGAAGGALNYATKSPEAKKNSSLLRNMAGGAALGTAPALGAHAVSSVRRAGGVGAVGDRIRTALKGA